MRLVQLPKFKWWCFQLFHTLYEKYITYLQSESDTPDQWFLRIYAGAVFLYAPLELNHSKKELEKQLDEQALKCILNTIWRFHYQYIRTSKTATIYRIQFLAPMEKSFCCGNDCPNCVRLQSSI